jgi:hypothetical protein
MDYAVLNLRFRKGCRDGLGKARQVIRAGNEDIFYAPLSRVVEYDGPEFALSFSPTHMFKAFLRPSKLMPAAM